jgi:hypothetical protein
VHPRSPRLARACMTTSVFPCRHRVCASARRMQGEAHLMASDITLTVGDGTGLPGWSLRRARCQDAVSETLLQRLIALRQG